MTDTTTTPHYVAPGRFTRRVFNPAVAWLTRRGLGVAGARLLEVEGRRSGQWRSVPVNLLDHDGRSHVVAARGETEWVRNLRAAGGGRLRLGRRAWTFRATEVPVEERTDVLRAYLRRWGWEVGAFFDGTSAEATDEELQAIAHRHPVFEVEISPAR